MVRLLLGSALTVLGLSLSALVLAPSLSGSPGGEPITVAAPGDAGFQQARLDAEDCAARFLFAKNESSISGLGLRIVALVIRPTTDGMAAAVDPVADLGALPDGALLVIHDKAGHVLAAGSAADLAQRMLAQGLIGACGPADEDFTGDI